MQANALNAVIHICIYSNQRWRCDHQQAFIFSKYYLLYTCNFKVFPFIEQDASNDDIKFTL